MWCINCGKKLPDEAKFCFACGTKVIEEAYEDAAVVSLKAEPETISTVSYKILGSEIKLDSRMFDYAKLRQYFQANATINAGEFALFYEENIKSIDDVVSKGFPKIIDLIKNSVNYGIQILISYGVEYVEYSELEELSYEFINPEKYFSPYIEEMVKIEGLVNEISEKRNNQRASRSYWSGGGFGIGGAIKGALTAGVMNIGMNAFYGIEDSFQDTNDKKRILQAKENAFTDEIEYDLIECVKECCFNVFYTVLGILAEEKKVPLLLIEEKGKEEAVLNNYLKMYRQGYTDKETAIAEQIVKCISRNPFNFSIYGLWITWCMYEWTAEDMTALNNFAEDLYIKDEVLFEIQKKFNEYCIEMISEVSELEEDSLDIIEEYITDVEEFSEIFDFVDFSSARMFLTEEKEKVLKQYEKRKEIEIEYFSVSEFYSSVQKFIEYSMDSNYMEIWNEIEKGNSLYEYMLNHFFCDVYCKKWIEQHSVNAIKNFALELRQIQSPNTNYYQYLATRLEYETEKAYLWGKEEQERIENKLVDCVKSKNVCGSAMSTYYFLAGWEKQEQKIECMKYALKRMHPDAIVHAGRGIMNGEYGFQKDEEKGKELIAIAASVRQPYALKLAQQYKINVVDFQIPYPTNDIVESFVTLKEFHQKNQENIIASKTENEISCTKNEEKGITIDTSIYDSEEKQLQSEEICADSMKQGENEIQNTSDLSNKEQKMNDKSIDWLIVNEDRSIEIDYIPGEIVEEFIALTDKEPDIHRIKCIINNGAFLTETTKLKTIRSKMQIPDNEMIFVVADGTIFSTFGKGFAICKKAFRFVDSSKKCAWVSWEKFKDWEIEERAYLYVGGYGFNVLDGKPYTYLLKKIQEGIKQVLQEQTK